jgi:hypothetical protein
MKKLLLASALLALAGSAVWAQAPTATHTVTVEVAGYDGIQVTGSPWLTIAFDPMTGAGAATDATSQLSWITNQVAARKVTVYVGAAETFTYGLTVLPGAITRTAGAAGGEGTPVLVAVDLSTCLGVGNAKDVITGINQAGGWSMLTYNATATLADPIGVEPHQVTYTLTP